MLSPWLYHMCHASRQRLQMMVSTDVTTDCRNMIWSSGETGTPWSYGHYCSVLFIIWPVSATNTVIPV